MNKISSLVVTLLLATVFNNAHAFDVEKQIIQFSGTAIGEERMIADGTGGLLAALCFDIDMRDVKTGKIVGKGVDCLSDITTVSGGLSILATSIFEFENGTVVNRGLTSVQPKTIGSLGITHITGAIPTADEVTIITSLGTGDFANKTGQARLSGAVTMNPLADGRLEITFDCLFVLELHEV